MFGKSAVAKWDRELGRLVFEGVSLPANCVQLSDSCWLPDRWSVRFWLQNRATPAVGQALPFIEATSGIVGADESGFGFRAIGGIPLGRAAQIPEIRAASITQNTDIQNAQNNLTLSLTFSIDLPGYATSEYSSSIFVSGLVGTLTPDNDVLPLYGDDAALFAGRSAHWRQAEGKLSFAVAPGSSIVAGHNVQISILIKNPANTQPAVSPKARAEVRHPPRDAALVSISPLPLPEIPVSCRGLLASGTESLFTTKTVQESTQVNQASNRISVTLVCNIALPAGATIEVDGFTSSTDYTAGVMPISGPSAAILGEMAEFKVSVVTEKISLKMVLTSLVNAGEIISFYFVLQNPFCTGQCPGTTVTVSAQGGVGHPNIDIPAAALHSQTNGVLGAGVALSWIVKDVLETTNMRQAANTIAINLQLNANLYEGTQIVIKGLVSDVFETCLNCYTGGTTWALGSGCSVLCGACPETEDGPVAACVPILQDKYSTPHNFFENSLAIFNADGDLTMTMKEGHKIDSESPFRVILKMRNRVFPERRKECWRLGNQQSCLKVSISNGKLCSQVRPIPSTWHRGEMCDKGSQEVIGTLLSIQDGNSPMDRYGRMMLDTCATCLRLADIVAVDRVLQMQNSLIISNAHVSAPSIAGLPLLVSGGLVPGNYTVKLALRNWLDQQGVAEIEFSKDLGNRGQLHSENLKPTLYMQEYAMISGERAEADKQLSLLALAQPASCLPNAPRQVLRYEWTSACLTGSCALVPPLQAFAKSRSTRSLDLAANSLVAGTTYRFTIGAVQEAFIEMSKASVTVKVPVRNLVVDILGVSDGGTMGSGGGEPIPLMLAISDPEVRTSGFSKHTQFQVSWGCAVQQESSVCPPFPAVCSPAPYAPCPSGTLITPSCQAAADSLCEHQASLTKLVVGKQYKIDVNVTRDMFQLPSAIYDYRVPGAPMPVAWISRVHKTKAFQVVSDHRHVAASIIVCSAMELGTPELCTQPARNKVNANEKLVLKVTFQTTPTNIAISEQQWTVVSPAAQGQGQGILAGDNILANVRTAFSGLLILRQGVLTSGRGLTLRLDATSTLRDDASALIRIQVRLPPAGGALVVSPSSGVGMQTTFTLEASSWSTDPENLPLTYHFSCHDEGGDSVLQMPLRSGVVFLVQSHLPTSHTSNHKLVVSVKVSDMHYASSVASATVVVRDPLDQSDITLDQSDIIPLFDSMLRTHVDAFFRVGDILNAQVQICLMAHALNADEPCAPGHDPGACKYGDVASRQVLRARLMLTLQAGNYSLVPSSEALTSQAMAFQKILDRPAEISFETAALAVRLLANNIRAIKSQVGKMQIDTQTLAFAHGIAATRLLESLRSNSKLLFLRGASAQHEHPSHVYDSSDVRNLDNKRAEKAGGSEQSHRDTLERLRHAYESAATGRSSTQPPFPWEHNVMDFSLTWSSRSARLFPSVPSADQSGASSSSVHSGSTSRDALTIPSLRKLQYTIMNDMLAMISSLSLSQVAADAKPTVVHLPGCTINSSHVSMAALAQSGWKAQGNGSAVVATFPPAMLTQQVIGPALTSLEIMHVFWQDSFDETLNLPHAFGPFSIFQLRRRGSDTPIQFVEPLKIYWQLQMPLTKAVPEEPDDFVGSRQIPFGAWFDTDGYNWHWKTELLGLRTRPSANNMNLIVMQVFTVARSLYSIFYVEEGCDGLEQSRVYKDHCAVCGGDNSTCSGCDGIPNTGRDKGCSDHGQCKEIVELDEIKCACMDNWYDIMCSTYCDDNIHCSGHGLCHPDDGRSCICKQGWLAGDAAYPGPFCAEKDPNVIVVGGGAAAVQDLESIAKQEAATTRFILTVLLPAVFGAVFVSFVCYRVVYRAKM